MNDIEKSTKGLNNVLFEQINLLRKGKTTPEAVREYVKLVNASVNVVKLELEAARYLSESSVKDGTNLKAIDLG